MTQDFSSQTLKAYLDVLGSAEPSPGGGSAAALAGSLAASLGEMVSRINAKKVKSNPEHERSAEHASEIQAIREKMLKLVTRDAEAFEEVSKFWKDKSPALQDALKSASEVPYDLCQHCHEVVRLAKEEIPVTSKHLISDLAECGLLAKAAFQAARFNVEINLKAMEDMEFVAARRKELDQMEADVFQLAEELTRSFTYGKTQ